jgi:hypothetical protein
VLAAGQALLLANRLAGVSAFASIALRVAIRVPREEGMMIEHFGDEYRDDMRRSGGVVARLRARARAACARRAAAARQCRDAARSSSSISSS